MNHKIILLTVILIFLNVIFVNSEAHICTNTRIHRQTKLSPYIVTEWQYVRKFCWNYLWYCTYRERVQYTKYYTETITTTGNYRECCSGYNWLHDKKKCAPICINPCVNGVCTAPNACTCDLGYVKSASDQYVCMLDCKDSCIGGTCTESKICQCLPHATLVSNTTHNFCECDMGYQMTDTGVCVPVCMPACVNGTCASPGKCTCSPGYNASDVWNVCRPACTEVCEGNCADGNCTNQNGNNSDSMSMQNLRDNTNYWTSIGIGLGVTAVLVISGSYFLYKKKICQKTANEAKDTDEYIVTNSIYGWSA